MMTHPVLDGRRGLVRPRHLLSNSSLWQAKLKLGLLHGATVVVVVLFLTAPSSVVVVVLEFVVEEATVGSEGVVTSLL